MGHADQSRPVVIHIGYHKTATTWLQRAVFPKLEGVCAGDWAGMLRRELVVVNPYEFDATATRDLVLSDVEVGDVALISYERLSGHYAMGGLDSSMLAQRLNESFPEAKVLMTIRRQPDMVLASYGQYVRGGGTESIRRFLRPPRDGYRMPHFDLRYLEYHHLIAHYQPLFGVERVKVLAYEQLGQSAADFAQQVAEFVGVPGPGNLDAAAINRSSSPLVRGAQRRGNVLLRGALNPNGLLESRLLSGVLARRLKSFDQRLPEAVRRVGSSSARTIVESACQGRFAESNDRTVGLTGLALGDLGCDVTTPAAQTHRSLAR